MSETPLTPTPGATSPTTKTDTAPLAEETPETEDPPPCLSFLHTAVARTQMAIWAIDKNDTITSFDGAVLKDGFETAKPADLIGKNLKEVMGETEGFDEALAAAKKGRPVDVIYKWGPKYCRTRMQAFENGVFGVCTVETDQVLQTQLLHMITESHACSRAKMDFIATISHELRTPLAEIITVLDLLGDGTDVKADHLKQYLIDMRRSSNQMATIINDFLDISKFNKGRLSLESISFTISSVLQESASLFRNTVNQKGLNVKVLPISVSDAPRVGDPNRIKQIICNYISNAIKFTPKNGSIEVGVDLEIGAPTGITTEEKKSDTERSQSDHTPDSTKVRFFVKDSGPGIDEITKMQLFQDYTQANASISRIHGGTGLGLSLCLKLAQMMGGEAGCDSSEGEGSTFWATIPLPCSGSGADREVDGGSADVSELPYNVLRPVGPCLRLLQGKPKANRVLVADDSLTILTVMRKFLHKSGYMDVVTSSNGRDALQLWQESIAKNVPFEFLFIDQNMPEMGGDEVATIIRKEGCRVTQPRIYSISGDLGSEETYQERGFDGVLHKPFTLDRMVNLMKRASVSEPNVAS